MGTGYAEVIGDPVAHSKSPLIHNYWLERLGIRADYRATHVRADELPTFLRTRRSDPDWLGCNVTIPHKEAALKCIDQNSREAAAIGAVNCIVPRTKGLTGFNTDVDGIAAALGDLELEDRNIVVIGAGGAARAVLAYLADRNVRTINLLVRNPQKAEGLKEIVPADLLRIGSFNEGSLCLAGAAAIINASPLGMTGCPEMPSALLRAVAEQSQAALFDMVYDPVTTSFLSLGRSQRIDGLSMLVGQAARAFELFFGARPPLADEDLRSLILR